MYLGHVRHDVYELRHRKIEGMFTTIVSVTKYRPYSWSVILCFNQSVFPRGAFIQFRREFRKYINLKFDPFVLKHIEYHVKANAQEFGTFYSNNKTF